MQRLLWRCTLLTIILTGTLSLYIRNLPYTEAQTSESTIQHCHETFSYNGTPYRQIDYWRYTTPDALVSDIYIIDKTLSDSPLGANVCRRIYIENSLGLTYYKIENGLTELFKTTDFATESKIKNSINGQCLQALEQNLSLGGTTETKTGVTTAFVVDQYGTQLPITLSSPVDLLLAPNLIGRLPSLTTYEVALEPVAERRYFFRVPLDQIQLSGDANFMDGRIEQEDVEALLLHYRQENMQDWMIPDLSQYNYEGFTRNPFLSPTGDFMKVVLTRDSGRATPYFLEFQFRLFAADALEVTVYAPLTDEDRPGTRFGDILGGATLGSLDMFENWSEVISQSFNGHYEVSILQHKTRENAFWILEGNLYDNSEWEIVRTEELNQLTCDQGGFLPDWVIIP